MNVAKNLVIAHGDGDGVIAAASILAKFFTEEFEVVFTQPFLLSKLDISDNIENIYIVDIAVDNKNPAASLDFARKHAHRIALWADHHQGSECLVESLGKKALVDTKSPSCPQMLQDAGYLILPEWVAGANACDRPLEFAPTPLSKRYNAAFKAALAELQEGNKTIVEKIQQEFLEELMSNISSDIISDYCEKYAELEANTSKAAESVVKMGNIAYTKLDAHNPVDKTGLCTLLYEHYDTVIMQFISNEERLVTMIATKRKDLNLVSLFELPSGAPFRVSIEGDFDETLKSTLAKLANA